MHDASENFRSVPKTSEPFGNIPNLSERKENHILTAREVTRMFEEASVSRTERSIINWCHPDKHGVSRLDAYYDPNERKYFITPQSVERAIQEEQAKAKTSTMPDASETAQRGLPNGAASAVREREEAGHETFEDRRRVRELEQEILDLKITNKGKDYFLEQLKADRERDAQERAHLTQQLIAQSRAIGELETRLLQLEAPKHGAEIIEPGQSPREVSTDERVTVELP